MVTQETAINESKKFIIELQNFGLNLKKAYLFGSFLDNRQHNDSDIDVAIVADEFIGVGPVDVKLILEILRKYKTIHATTYSSSDLNEGNPFLDYIRKTGMELL